jgi:membrane-associated protein
MFNVTHLIQTGGLVLIAAVIFAESGMMIGFLFPGDTLLLSAGVLAAGGTLSLPLTIIVISIAAILGDNVGYHIGRHVGRRLFSKADGIVFRHEYIMRAEAFYKKHGSKTMLVAHFVPVVRSFAPVAAGAAKMPLSQFMIFDAIGDIAWSVAITCFGFFVGSRVPGIDRYIEPLLIIIVLIFLTPTLYHIAKDQKIRSAIIRIFKK